jgi:hypothetical protein
MRFLYKNNPKATLKFVGRYLPNELVIEISLQEFDDDDIDSLIEQMRNRLEEQRAIESKPRITVHTIVNGDREVAAGESAAVQREAGEGRNSSPPGDRT